METSPVKLTQEHYQTLCHAIYRSQQGSETLEEYKNHGLTAKRWRWDLLWRAKRVGFLPDRFIEDQLYVYVNDDHIDTALRRITGTT
jgi:hypothetical protein